MNNIISSFIQDVWINKNLDKVKDYIAPDYVAHAMKGKTTISGVEGVKRNLENILEKYPDFVIEIDDIFGDENKIATRLKFKPNINSDISMREIIIHEVRNGKIYQAWSIGSDWD
jgi:predicted ester cyclase